MAEASSRPAPELCVALDFSRSHDALALAHQLQGTVSWLKVGLELYTAQGPAVVGQLRDLGFRVFLDLKLHDIPNTVAGAVRTAKASGASLLNVHALGGSAMMSAARDAAGDDLALIAVTILTSMDAESLAAVGIAGSTSDAVHRLAKLAWTSGLTGFVCSAQEAAAMRAEFGKEALLVTPGIRPAGSETADQSRTATPAFAVSAGSNLVVVGRPINRAADPLAASRLVLAEMLTATRF